jgi:hypothetical protein
MGGTLMQTMSQPAKKRVPNAKETEIINVLRKIREGRITTCMEVNLELARHSQEWRDTIGELLKTFVHDGEEMFWEVYDSVALCYPPFGEWRSLLDVPAPRDKKVQEPPPSDAILLSEVEEEEIAWLWEQRLALGKVTMLDGDPGQGKSMLTLDLAARVTRGIVMPDLTRGLPAAAGVVLIAPEDHLGDTVRPRLRRAGADLARVASLGTIPVTDPSTGYTYRRPFSLSEDLERLERAIDRIGARLLIIDPVMSLLGGKDAYRDNEIRMLLTPLQMLLEKKRVAGLLVRHLTKSSSSINNALYRGGGSIAFVALARTAMMVLKDPYDEGKNVLVHTKSNIGRIAPILSFSVDSDEAPGDIRPHVCWHGTRNYSHEELFSSPPSTPREGRKSATARDEILRVLEEHAPEALTPMEVAKELPEMSLSTIQVTLQRLAKDGSVGQPARGKYGTTTQN